MLLGRASPLANAWLKQARKLISSRYRLLRRLPQVGLAGPGCHWCKRRHATRVPPANANRRFKVSRFAPLLPRSEGLCQSNGHLRVGVRFCGAFYIQLVASAQIWRRRLNSFQRSTINNCPALTTSANNFGCWWVIYCLGDYQRKVTRQLRALNRCFLWPNSEQ
jgi:hypothetical protein